MDNFNRISYRDPVNEGLGTKITQQGRTVANAVFDNEFINVCKTQANEKRDHFEKVYPTASTDDVNMSMLPGEVAISHRKNHSMGSAKRRKLADGIMVISSLNGLQRPKNEPLEETQKRFRFVGFADIESLYTSTGVQNEDSVVQVSGLRTTINTGESHIKAGDQIYWSFPKYEHAARKKKVLVALNPVRNYYFYSKENMKALLQQGGRRERLQNITAEFEKCMRELSGVVDERFFECWATFMSEVTKEFIIPQFEQMKSNIIGTAMSSAKPNEPFDILVKL